MSEEPVVEPAVEPTVEPSVEPAVEPSVESPAEPVTAKKTIANGKDDTPAEPEAKPYWPEDWREKAAAHVAAGDDKAYKKELKRLDRITDPTGIYGSMRELEAKFSKGGLVKIPGKSATDEDVAEFHKAMGVPEKAEDYFKNIKLDNGAIIGEADRPVADDFAGAIHKVGATPAVVNAAMNWYFNNQEQQAAELDERDDNFKTASMQELKEEYGPAYPRYTNSVGSLFTDAPGGLDLEADNSLYARLMGGRMADGKMVGDDPDMVRWLVSKAREINPIATVVEGGDQSGMSLAAELKDIQKLRRSDKREYYSDKVQAREQELLDAQARDRARA